MALNTEPSTIGFQENQTKKATVVRLFPSSLAHDLESAHVKRLQAFTEVKDTDQNLVREYSEAQRSKADRMYPHILDPAVPEGEVVGFIKHALKDAQNALEDYGEPDLAAVQTHLTQIAATMSKAHSLTSFNESLGAVVSYIRRATLSASIEEISRPSLNALVNVLQSLISDPILGLYEASELVDKLSDEGWHGEHAATEALISALFNDIDIEPNSEPSDLIEKLLHGL